ncbi:hypothetical protein QOL99_15495 [Deinococcus sp. MIMF12]|uniref:Glycoside hydrolase family 42 N-terminal domain-containing protein n=1 Tax=Deinococcus rhizophilus TaxID=3049544 RepID=A0ABT7JM62_9DEIO|nr:hypothetical protein [Deinococcus rhizophilus]MDL2345543.1 hypothetical protein [Deinococcus rhizophilus]
MWKRLLACGLLLGTVTGCALVAQFAGQPGQRTPAAPVRLAPDPTLMARPSTEIGHRADGTVTVEGRPFFPLGFYHVSWAGGGTPGGRQEDLRRLSEAGFNLMVTEPINDRDVSDFEQTLNAAQRSGVYVMSYGLGEATVKRVGHHPAVLGFKLADDSNVLVKPEEVRRRHAQLKALSPDKLTYISLSVGFGRPETAYFGVSDMVGNQSYPVGSDDISVTYPVMRSAVESALARRSVPVANLQTFAWEGKPLPSEAELRNMTYQALMAGVKGIVYYAYRSREVDLGREPRLWQAAGTLAGEIAQLSPALLNGERQELSDGRAGRPVVVVLRGRGGDFLLALNNSRTKTQTVRVPLSRVPGGWQVMAGKGSSLTRRGGQVSGQLAPLQVVAYRLSGR